MQRLRDALGGRRAVSVTSAVVQRYVLARQKEGAASATIDREAELLRRPFAHAKETGRLSFAPHVPRQSHAYESARQGFLDRADFDAILEKIADEDFRDYLEWSWWTGMRPGELASLSWNAYDEQTKTLRLAAEDAKIGKGRVVPVIGPLAAIIERREAKRITTCWLVFHSGGQRMTRSTGGLLDRLYDAWSKACKATGQVGLIPYMTSAGRPSETSARLVSRNAWQWRSRATRPARCSTATASWTSATCGTLSRRSAPTSRCFRRRER